MKIKRVEILQNIAAKLGLLKNQIELENQINFYNNNIGSENLMCGLLNYIYGWNLVNLNKKEKNYPGIDLGDEKKKIAVQITSDNSRKKVQNTIDTFLKNEHEKIYSRLVILVLGNKTRFNKDFNTKNKFVFDRKNDVIDIKQIIKDLDKCDDEVVWQVQSYLEEKIQVSDNKKKYKEKSTFLLEIRKKVYAMCLTKLKTLGISEEIGKLIIEEGIAKKQHEFMKQNGVKFLVGDFGSGKSHLLYENMLVLVDCYLKKETEKFPVFLEASDIKKYGSILEYCQNINIDIEQSVIIIDSLDEVDYDMIEKIVNETEYLDNRYNNINIIIGSRQMSFLAGKRIIDMPLLPERDINVLYTRITGDSCFKIEHRFRGEDKKRMKMMLGKPFFAILYAIYMNDHKLHIKNEVDLVNYFIEKSMQPYLLKNPNIYMHFEKMSILSIERNYGNIHKSEIPIDINVEALIKSGFVRLKDDENLVFNLPIIVQWLGARAIRNQLIDFSEIVNNEVRLLKWRYSLSIMFNQMTYEESEKYISYLVENSVDLVGTIIRDGITFEGKMDISDEMQSGQKMYKCMQSWIKGLGILAEALEISNNGIVNTLAIQCTEQRIEFSWANKYLDRDVICLKDAMHTRCFSTVYGRSVPAQATWPWVVTFECLSELIEDSLENKKWLMLDGAMEREFVWKNTLKLENKGSLYTSSFKIEDINKHRTKGQGYKKIDIETYFYLVDRLRKSGKKRIEVPYIVGDQEAKTNFIWGNYSEEQMRLRVKDIYENVFDEYTKMIEKFFGCFRTKLSTYITFPCKLVGSLCYDDSETDCFYPGPSLQYYLEPLELGKESIVEISLNDDRDYFGHNSEEIFEMLKKSTDKYRRQNKEFINVSICGGGCMNSSPTPVTDIVYQMLKKDLKKIAWIKD